MKKYQRALLFLAAIVCLLLTSCAGTGDQIEDLAVLNTCTIEAGANCEFFLNVDGRSRSYLLHIPVGYDGKAVALVIDAHGFTGTPEWQKYNSGMYELSDAKTFAVVYPRGGPLGVSKPYEKGFNGSAYWVNPGCCGTPVTEDWDDVALMVAIKKDVASKIEVNKFYFTGLSNGSYMGHRLLCEAPNEFDAYATTSAALSDSWDGCEPSNTRPLLYLHGRNDKVQPIDGSMIGGERILSTTDTMAIYASRNACTGYPDSYTITFSGKDGSWCREYKGCAKSVAYCELKAAHITYGASDLDVAEIFWNFFSRH